MKKRFKSVVDKVARRAAVVLGPNDRHLNREPYKDALERVLIETYYWPYHF